MPTLALMDLAGPFAAVLTFGQNCIPYAILIRFPEGFIVREGRVGVVDSESFDMLKMIHGPADLH